MLKTENKEKCPGKKKRQTNYNATFHAKIIRMSRPSLLYIFGKRFHTKFNIICEPPQTLISAPSCLMRNCWGAQQRRRLNNRGIM